MAKRGRPSKNDVKEDWVLFRSLLALDGYGRSRKDGEKYSEALKAGVAEVRQKFPGMPVSPTEVKRVLAEFQPRAQALGLRVAKPESSDNHDVGLELLDSFNRLNTITGLAAYLPIRQLLQQPAQ